MPEVDFIIAWPDGSRFTGVSPSRAIERWIVAGASYPSGELVRRVQVGLTEASERVRARYGFACTAAAEVADQLLASATRAGVNSTGASKDADAPATVLSVKRRAGRWRPVSDTRPLPARTEVAVIGGGQAGLTASWYLTRHGIDHVVIERDQLASSWRHQRWDNFCLVTPNWQCTLAEFAYSGEDPDGFMVKDEIIGYVEGFAASFDPPLYEGVAVKEVTRDEPSGGFRVQTSAGELQCAQVILCVGGYHDPGLPAIAKELPERITQLHSSQYKNATSLPDGAVLVVGTGQSGAQIAEDLHLAGRQVHLCVGSAPRVARFYRGRDCVAWLEDIGHYRMPITEHKEGLAARKEPNHYVTGRGGGHDIDLRAFAAEGLELHGRLQAVDGDTLTFAGDLPKNLDAADATMERIKDTIDSYIAANGIDAPTEERYTPAWHPESDGSTPLHLAAAEINSVVWATGFRSNWSWLKLPLLDEKGYPEHVRGVCTRAPGVYVLGLPWLHTWGSGRFAGINEDARHVTDALASRAELVRAA